jgi:hypothetical protein
MPTMKTVELNIYSFDELSDAAKDKARQWYRETIDFGWDSESIDSIKTFCNHYGVRLTNWSIGANCPYSYDIDYPPSTFRGLKLKDVDRNAMPTGYCLDCTLWFTFYDTFKATGCAAKAFEAALDQAFKDWRADMESQLEDQYADEYLIANDYQFTENGTIF